MRKVAAIVLAAGKGTRIKSTETNKVLLPLADKPMIGYGTQLLKALNISPIIIVVGFKKEEVMKFLGKDFDYAYQEKLLGTGHAVKKAIGSVPRTTKHVLVINGDDSAFYSRQLIRRLINHHRGTGASITLLTAKASDPTGYGRILRGKDNTVLGIREEALATEKEKAVKEINTGTYCFSFTFLTRHLSKLKKNPIKGEYYLTDMIELAIKNDKKVETIRLTEKTSFVGINTRKDLRYADRLMRQRKVT